MHTLDVIDSHTAGEPTRVVVAGFPDLGGDSLARCRERFAAEFDHWRSAIACEPRGSDAMVGAVLLPARDPRACSGVVFFNNVGYLGMCGHGTIGVVRTLQHLGRIGPGRHYIETPVGTVGVDLDDDGRVHIDNVESYRHAKDVAVQVPGHGEVRGDVAWGGNWFFITGQAPCPLDLAHQRELTAYTEAIRQALEAAGITGAEGGEIDHVEVNGSAPDGSGQARNFVLCPGLAYDRSPCGTGTSAKLACLAADGKLAEGESWLQQGILGSVFEGSYRRGARGVA
ncbi:UNVERIFIED_ORG: hydroxyproline-2-epimerase, partial [Rhodanobacter sp. FW104-R5]